MTQKSPTPRELYPEWPDVPALNPAHEKVRIFAKQVQQLAASEGTPSFRRLADKVGVARSTLSDITTGQSWPNTLTLARLEEALEMRLWP